MTFINVIIVGAGPAGIGIASLLSKTDIDYIVLEKKEVGSSFISWPENMEMITPSFPSNAFGQMDLNAVAPLTSPAFAFGKEHLTGIEYAKYLSKVEALNEVEVETHTEVQSVEKQGNSWIIQTNKGKLICRYLIWAAGEFSNPQMKGIAGAEYCIHSSAIERPSNLEGDDFIIIGGYESGVQMGLWLIENGKKVTIINPTKVNDLQTSDPSKVLSPYTLEKYKKLKQSANYTEIIGAVENVLKSENNYCVQLEDNRLIKSKQKPICATGFSLVKKPIEQLITLRDDGLPILNEETDELLNQRNIYLAGPSVRHGNHIFCFIYKFRQRFGVIVEDILNKELYNVNDIVSLVKIWKYNGLYLSDLSCCDEECLC
ncbi:MAG: NAD(P)-binding domain-containing protein [Crocinitomicaceae bacterium]|nr:NAD(P)-binding domain-containing protein [Crocinitomicaceae bacterium]